MSTFLQLSQYVHRECGLAGNGPSEVSAQTGQLRNIVKWVADADEQIQSLYNDWDFLWAQFQTNTIATVATYTAPSDIGLWNQDSFFLDYTTDTHQRLNVLDYQTWYRTIRQGTRTNAKPTIVVVLPNKNLILDRPPDAVYSLTADYWKRPTRMTVNASTSLIPAQFERVIITRAKMFVFDDTGDREQYNASAAEFQAAMRMLEADQLSSQTYKAMSGYVDMQVRLG